MKKQLHTDKPPHVGAEYNSRPGARLAPVLFGIQFIAAIASSVYVWFQSMGIAGCADACNFRLVQGSVQAVPIWSVLLLVVVGALLIILPRRRAQGPSPADAWVPLGGIVLTVVGAGVASFLIVEAISTG